MKTTLIAVSGISPAILTETIWALSREEEPEVPDQVVVITTTRGALDIDRELLGTREEWNGRSVWETLRSDVLASAGIPARSKKLQLSVRVIELPDEESGIMRKAADLRTKEDNEAAADFIVETLTPFVEASDHRVIASIAGGRKTMGALLYAAMSLIGRETDRITHVLVSEPFEACRGFFYPDQPTQLLRVQFPGQDARDLVAREARIELAGIPFVPLRNGFAELNEERRSFAELVSRYSRELQRPRSRRPRISIDPENGILFVEQKRISLTGRTLLVAYFLLDRARRGKEPYKGLNDEAENDYRAVYDDWKHRRRCSQLLERYYDGQRASADDIVKALSDLRKKLEEAGAADCIPFLAPKRKRIGFDAEVTDPPS